MTKRDRQLIGDCIILLINEKDMNEAFKQGKNTAPLVWQALKPYKLKAIKKMESYIKELKEELNA